MKRIDLTCLKLRKNTQKIAIKASGAVSDHFSKSFEICAPNSNLFSQIAFLYYLINAYFWLESIFVILCVIPIFLHFFFKSLMIIARVPTPREFDGG